MIKMSKILEFLQNDKKEFSSKRVGYLSTVPFAIVGTFWICYKLIASNQAEHVVNIWLGFYIYSAVLGGFVAVEPIQNIFSNFVNKKTKKNDK